VTFLPLKVGGVSGVLGKGKGCIIVGILRVAIGDEKIRVEKAFYRFAGSRVNRLVDSLSVCLSICLSVYLSICLFVCLSGCLFIWLSVCLAVCGCHYDRNCGCDRLSLTLKERGVISESLFSRLYRPSASVIRVAIFPFSWFRCVALFRPSTTYLECVRSC
jgi:hypothetical protein